MPRTRSEPVAGRKLPPCASQPGPDAHKYKALLRRWLLKMIGKRPAILIMRIAWRAATHRHTPYRVAIHDSVPSPWAGARAFFDHHAATLYAHADISIWCMMCGIEFALLLYNPGMTGERMKNPTSSLKGLKISCWCCWRGTLVAEPRLWRGTNRYGLANPLNGPY